jgi:hypothetical protein
MQHTDSMIRSAARAARLAAFVFALVSIATIAVAQTRPSGKGLDTPDNVERVRRSLTETFNSLDPALLNRDASAGSDACMKAMQPFDRYRNYLNSGYDELNAKCGEMAKPMYQAYVDKARSAYSLSEQAKADAQKAAMRRDVEIERAAKQREADQVAEATAQLRSGKQKPTNCSQYMVAKGHDPKSIDKSVMDVAFQPPAGVGQFLGRVERIENNAIVLNDRIPDIMRVGVNIPEHTIVRTAKDAQIFAGDRIRTGATVFGYGTQIGTQNVKLASGAAATIAVVSVACMQPME